MSLLDLRRVVRESFVTGYGYVRLQSLFQRRSPDQGSVIFFPGQMYTGSAGDLRACAVARELRSMGWRTIIVPPWLDLKARLGTINREPSAVLFFQQSRHRLNSPRLYPSRFCVYDADDADILSEPVPVIECLRSSSAVIAGSHFLADEFRKHNSNVHVIWTGTYVTDVVPLRPSSPPIIAWAQSNPFDYPEEAQLVRSLWETLAREGVLFEVRVYSNDPSRCMKWLNRVHELGVRIDVLPTMRYRAFIQSLSSVTIGLQPICTSFPFSRGKSFGKVLAYMAAHVPVIASDEVDHRLFFRNGVNGMLVNSLSDWTNACKRLLNNPSECATLARGAYDDMLTHFTSRRAAELLHNVLKTATR
jgi:hypothetical protein